MQEYKYTVAGHAFSVQAAEGIDLTAALAPYAPFADRDKTAAGAGGSTSPGPGTVFLLTVVQANELPVPEKLALEFEQDDDGSQIRVFRPEADGGSWFEFLLHGRLSGRMRTDAEFGTAVLSVHTDPDFALNNALMVLYALRTARHGTALFHAAAVAYKGRGYLFLGRSGTGKSTHARLWLKHIPGAELLNDDNPVVRVFPDGTARVYGSPWSGKTPCYRNLDLPAGGFVQLAQAPHNAIRRLRGLGAYAALVASISGKRWDRNLADGLHETEEALTARIPVWHLDCLPDEAAARLCRDTIATKQE